MKPVVICLVKAALVSAVIVLLLMLLAVLVVVILFNDAQSSNPHAFQELGIGLGSLVFPILFFMLSLGFWMNHQDTRIVRFQDKQVFMDRLNSEAAKMRLREKQRSDTFLSFKLPFLLFSKNELSVDLSNPGLATLSGRYLPVKTLQQRLTRQ